MELKRIGILLIALVALYGGLAPHAEAAGAPYTCTGGAIPPGTYSSVTVTGSCTIPASAAVIVNGNLTITSNAVLNAITENSKLTVTGSVIVQYHGSFGLGCSPAAGCSSTTSDSIGRGLTADHPLELILHSNTITGGLSMQGGGSGAECDTPSRLVQYSPEFSTFEDNQIHGGAQIYGYQSCWLGFIRNNVGGTTTITNNTLGDPDSMEVVTNTVHGLLACQGNTPQAQFGDSGGSPNTVIGGQNACPLLPPQ